MLTASLGQPKAIANKASQTGTLSRFQQKQNHGQTHSITVPPIPQDPYMPSSEAFPNRTIIPQSQMQKMNPFLIS